MTHFIKYRTNYLEKDVIENQISILKNLKITNVGFSQECCIFDDNKMTRIIIIIIGRVILVSQSWHEIEKSTVQMASLEKILYVRYCSDLIS